MLLHPVRYDAFRLVYRSIKGCSRHGRGLGPQVELRDLGCSHGESLFVRNVRAQKKILQQKTWNKTNEFARVFQDIRSDSVINWNLWIFVQQFDDEKVYSKSHELCMAKSA